MRYFVAVIIGFLSFTWTTGQTPVADQLAENEYEAACGKPLADGKVYDYREGKVTRIGSGNRLVFEQLSLNGDEKRASYFLQPAGINVKENETTLAKFLSSKIVGKNVVVAGNSNGPSDKNFFGSIWVEGIGDVSKYVLRNGIARFADPEYQAISAYTLCVFRQIADQAKAKRVGIWANM